MSSVPSLFRAHTVTEPQYHSFTNWEFVCVALRCASWHWTVNPPIWFAVFKVLICRFDSFTKPTLAAMFTVHISQDYSVSLLLFASVIQMRLSAVSLSHDSDLWPYQSYDSHTKCRVRLLNIHVKFNIHFTQNALQTRKGLSIIFIAFKRKPHVRMVVTKRFCLSKCWHNMEELFECYNHNINKKTRLSLAQVQETNKYFTSLVLLIFYPLKDNVIVS